MDNNFEVMRDRFENLGLFMPENGQAAYTDLEELIKRVRNWIWFDLDKTLFFPRNSSDRDQVIQSQAICYLAGRKGIAMEKAAEEWGEAFTRTTSGSQSLSELLGISRDSAKELMKHIISNTPVTPFIESDMELVTGINDLRDLRGIRLGVVTASPPNTATRVLGQLGFGQDCFDFVLAGEINKHNGEAYNMAFSKLPANLADYRTGMMVGDNIQDDIIPAQTMGIPTVWITETFSGEVDTLQASSVKSLIRSLEMINQIDRK